MWTFSSCAVVFTDRPTSFKETDVKDNRPSSSTETPKFNSKKQSAFTPPSLKSPKSTLPATSNKFGVKRTFISPEDRSTISVALKEFVESISNEEFDEIISILSSIPETAERLVIIPKHFRRVSIFRQSTFSTRETAAFIAREARVQYSFIISPISETLFRSPPISKLNCLRKGISNSSIIPRIVCKSN